jgi:hypothetical protein
MCGWRQEKQSREGAKPRRPDLPRHFHPSADRRWSALSSRRVFRSYSRLRLKSNDPVGILVLNLAQICVQPVEISAELGVELAARFASLFNDWIFHDVNLPSVPDEYRFRGSKTRARQKDRLRTESHSFGRQSERSERMPPAEAWEPAVVTVGCNPLAARLDRQGGQKCVCNEVAGGARDRTEVNENLPVPIAWSDQDGVRLIAQELAKLERAPEWRRRMKNLWVRNDPQETAQNKVTDAKGLRPRNDSLKPVAKPAVISGVFSVRVDQYVHVGENHDRSPSTRAGPHCRPD